MVSQVLEKFRVGGDFLIGRMPDPNYSYEQVELDNTDGSAVLHLPAGQPMELNGTVITHTAEASTTALLLQEVHVAIGEKLKVAVLARGPAVVNFDALPTKDPAGTTYTAGTLLTAVQAMHDVVVRREPTVQFEQTT